MKNIEVVRYKQQLDDLFDKISKLPEDAEMQSHWARYLCIQVSGFLEVSVRSIYSKYAQSQASPFVANYVEKQLSGFQNPKMEKILDIAKSFNPKWSERLSQVVQGEIKESIDSIVANRNNIAHGRNVGITYTRIKGYYQNAVKLIDLLEKQCEGQSI
ncbi:HEPN domain-containing protein [Lyngbya sp. CCY1209]|uniref:HEPN domain-containing protein n=1 Tax=Lyngbya sp. CCY1209 TaxID=2886103 RepID=UPI002D202E31|nr:HEPN domain-containing protein [Lyngbya sp. CCY1209]MEB3884543.1 hypothetical protein [Lyngbya sp. CCY1209]